MHRSISLAACLALLMMPAGATTVYASASGGISGTGGYNDTGSTGSTSGAAAGDNENAPHTMNPTTTSSVNASRHHKQNSTDTGGSMNNTYGNGTVNGPATGNGAYNGPNGTLGATK